MFETKISCGGKHMINAKQIKKVVDSNRKYLDIPSRSVMTQMIYFVVDLLNEAGYEDAAYFAKALADEVDNMDTLGIVKERIW